MRLRDCLNDVEVCIAMAQKHGEVVTIPDGLYLESLKTLCAYVRIRLEVTELEESI